MLRVEHLKKTFITGGHQLPVLKGLSFSISDGEFVSIIGRSGSGKSTLLFLLSLLDTPTSGTVFFDNKNMNDLPEDLRTNVRLTSLGYIFQDYALMPTLTALENIMLPMLMQGKTTEDAKKYAQDALLKVGLVDKENNLPSQLSGGEQQRVSIARAVAHNPKIIFADEPTANLDSESADVIIHLFEKLNHQGQTIVMVTHEHEYALRTKRIITIADGLIVSDQKNKPKEKKKVLSLK